MESSSSTSSLMKHPENGIQHYRSVNGGSSVSSDSAEEPARNTVGLLASLRHSLTSEVDAGKVAPFLSAYAFMTGYIDAISFSSIFVWCGFQTGNFAQLALAFARRLESVFLTTPAPTAFTVRPVLQNVPPPSEAQSFCSLVAFIAGLLIFGRLGDKIGTHKRGWLVGGTLIQACLTLASALTFWSLEAAPIPALAVAVGAGDAAFSTQTVAVVSMRYFFGIACLSASLGVQGIMARRLNTPFSTTIVLTAAFVELATDPALFYVRRSVPSRDHKWMVIGYLFLGVVVGRLVLGQLGTAATIGVAVLIRVAIAFSWLLIPARHVHLP
ncbi:hypothetical protein FA15DRAFT_668583 [Coprinopsis marcescibilis]|uniref:DUF1275 domain protein n=1 Tax=Coprinopsis marcescibilis TaxID=230819 RepID=A0A5C3KYG9_COPMA|nr:hypothetical protein FA15DRAFT_668583 [Coprinopsis marcescibilis]